MQTIVITISKDSIAKSMETLLWKYGSSIEGADNFRLVYNTKSDSANNAIDARVIDDSWETRTQEAIGFLRDFTPSVTQTAGTKTVSVPMSDRWGGNQNTLKSAVEKYILDAMMHDWLTATAPNEATLYENRLAGDERKIKADAYSLKKPSIA